MFQNEHCEIDSVVYIGITLKFIANDIGGRHSDITGLFSSVDERYAGKLKYII